MSDVGIVQVSTRQRNEGDSIALHIDSQKGDNVKVCIEESIDSFYISAVD